MSHRRPFIPPAAPYSSTRRACESRDVCSLVFLVFQISVSMDSAAATHRVGRPASCPIRLRQSPPGGPPVPAVQSNPLRAHRRAAAAHLSRASLLYSHWPSLHSTPWKPGPRDWSRTSARPVVILMEIAFSGASALPTFVLSRRETFQRPSRKPYLASTDPSGPQLGSHTGGIVSTPTSAAPSSAQHRSLVFRFTIPLDSLRYFTPQIFQLIVFGARPAMSI